MKHLFSRRVFALLAICLLLSSCATKPPAPPPESPLGKTLEQFDIAESEGDWRAAADALLRAAELSEDPVQAAQWRMQAVHYLGDAGAWTEATPIAEALAASEQAKQLQLPLALWRIRQLLQQEQADAAYEALQPLQPPKDKDAFRIRYLLTKAETLAAVEQPLEAAQTRSELQPLLENDIRQRDNLNALWAQLRQVPFEEIQLRMPPAPDDFGGWLELAYFVETHQQDLRQLEDALRQWQSRYPSHPADRVFLEQLIQTARERLARPERIAVLLPLSGQLSAPSLAIRDGIVAAAMGDNRPYPSIRFFDLGSQGTYAIEAYDEARDWGANLIIGPLTKGALVELASRSTLPVPLLALNTLPTGFKAPPGLYQFGLAPEDDAVAAARLAHRVGYQRALVLAPESEWGRRVETAFRQAFESLDGLVLESGIYPANTADYSQTIEALLNLDTSQRRYRTLVNTLRRPMEFEPRRRQDVEFVFLAAYPDQARLIRPQLKFHRAIELPVITTSHSNPGNQSQRVDTDMVGIRLVDLPWMFPVARPTDVRSLDEPSLEGPTLAPRLYALGIDAYRVAMNLARLSSGDNILPGASGQLYMDREGLIHRDLVPAVYTTDGVQLADDPSPLLAPPTSADDGEYGDTPR